MATAIFWLTTATQTTAQTAALTTGQTTGSGGGKGGGGRSGRRHQHQQDFMIFVHGDSHLYR